MKSHKILNQFFNLITTDRFLRVAVALKRKEGSPLNTVHKSESSTTKKIEAPTKRAVLELAVTPPGHQNKFQST